MKKVISALLLIIFYLLLGFGIGEGVVRLAHLAPPAEPMGWFWQVPDPVTGWSHLPGSQGRSFNPMYEFDVSVSFNSRGLRAPESVGYEKPEDLYRVLILGDSFVEAIQVEYDETFGQQLALLLEDTMERPVQVLSAGAGGWGTDQQLLWLQEEGLRYEPDLVLLAVYPRNDFLNNSESLESANRGSIMKPFFHLQDEELTLRYFPYNPEQVPPVPAEARDEEAPSSEPGPLTGVGEWLKARSALYRYVDPRIRIAAPQFAAWLARSGIIAPGQESKLVAQGEAYIPITFEIYRSDLEPEWQEAIRLTSRLFGEVRRSAEEAGARTAAILVSAPETVYPSEWELIQTQYPAMQEESWDLSAPHRRALEALSEAQVPAIDLVEPFHDRAADLPPLHLTDDGHWTPAGHELAARALFNFLAAEGLTPALAGQQVPLEITPRPVGVLGWLVRIIVAIILVSIVWDMVRIGPLRWGRQVWAGLGTMGELLSYLFGRRRYALLPLVVILLLFGGLLVLAQASVVGPFIYTLI